MNIIEARGLGKCYGRSWALRACTLAIPVLIGAFAGAPVLAREFETDTFR